MGVMSGNSGMAWCSISLVLNLVSSQNAQRLLLVICCVAANATAHPHEHSRRCPPDLEHFPKQPFRYLDLDFDSLVTLLNDACLYSSRFDLQVLIFLLCFAIS